MFTKFIKQNVHVILKPAIRYNLEIKKKKQGKKQNNTECKFSPDHTLTQHNIILK